MENTKYDAIWVPGSFFEKGHWKLVPSSGGGGLGAIIMLFLLIIVLCIVVLVSPLIIVLIGFSIVKHKRFYASIVAILAMIYLFIDYKKKWITTFMIFGSNDSEGKFSDGILGIKYAPHFFIINSIAVGITVYFIASSYFINSKKSNDDLNSIEQDKNLISIVVGIVFGILCFFVLNNSYSEVDIKASEAPVDSTYISPNPIAEPESYQTSYTDTTNIPNDSIQSENINVQKYQIGQELDGGKVFQLNDDQTHGLLFYDSKIALNFDGAKNWCSNNNYRLPNIDELISIVNNFDVSKAEYYYWSSDFATDYEKRNLSISCKTNEIDGRKVSVDEFEYIKCCDYINKTVKLIERECSITCNIIAVKSF